MKENQYSNDNHTSVKIFLPVVRGANMEPTVMEQQQQFIAGCQRLVAQAQRINQLSQELEAAMFELKAIANSLNTQRRQIKGNSVPLKSVCQYMAIGLPFVGQQPDGSFILATRPVDLFHAEKEAAQVAQNLRHIKKTQKLTPSGNTARKKRASRQNRSFHN
ncbi:MAG: hypothetical protein VKL59_24015 [Nostocaceae cyanobacterium]|nr:hypothetical protein [Nostocaceae cyanobacterium]